MPETAQGYLSGGTGKKGVIDRIQQHFIAQGVRVHKEGTGPESAKKESEKAESEGGATETAHGRTRAKPGSTKRAVVEVGFHSLRHTFVSLCRESNAPLAVVESIVGHSNPAMTRHYTHVGEVAAGQAVAALPAVIGGAAGAVAAPASKASGADGLLGKVRGILERMTAADWEQGRSEALAILSTPALVKGAGRQVERG